MGPPPSRLIHIQIEAAKYRRRNEIWKECKAVAEGGVIWLGGLDCQLDWLAWLPRRRILSAAGASTLADGANRLGCIRCTKNR